MLINQIRIIIISSYNSDLLPIDNVVEGYDRALLVHLKRTQLVNFIFARYLVLVHIPVVVCTEDFRPTHLDIKHYF